MRRQDVLADAVVQSRDLLARYLRGFDSGNHVRQAPGLPNHAAWSLGHLALTMRRVQERLDQRPIPPRDFIMGKPERAGAPPQAYFSESVAFGSTPAADPLVYPAWDRCLAIFVAACDDLSAAVRGASDQTLDSSTPWGNATTTLGALVQRMTFHNGMHAGQIADLRRALGFPSIFA